MNTSERVSDADLGAYVDGELDAATCSRLDALFATRPDDAARLESYRRQNKELQNLFDPVLEEPIPAAMLDLVMKPAARPNRPVWMQIAAAVVLLISGAAGGWGLHALQQVPSIDPLPGYVQRAVGAHLVYAAEVLHPVEVAVKQEAHLVKWLSKRLGNPIRAPRLNSVGYQLIGGRLLEDQGKPAAQFMYENDAGRRVTVYARSNEAKDTAFKFFENAEVSAFYWIDAPFAFALSGDLPRPELLTIAHVVYEGLAK